ncbi:hypothetical protein NDU88_002744 [Pleurodeles waltl]|uniref:Uncharacterized protein n=1 Tax=Pleurodeles waltl TaxID=8319 RepID=A0AAV7UY86_PLEWA|nr:hypothetical protein NDU88_002744 [Pleurodeles waltl]
MELCLRVELCLGTELDGRLSSSRMSRAAPGPGSSRHDGGSKRSALYEHTHWPRAGSRPQPARGRYIQGAGSPRSVLRAGQCGEGTRARGTGGRAPRGEGELRAWAVPASSCRPVHAPCARARPAMQCAQRPAAVKLE